MKIVYTDEARQDLERIAKWLFVNYPAIAPKVEARIATSWISLRVGPRARGAFAAALPSARRRLGVIPM